MAPRRTVRERVAWVLPRARGGRPDTACAVRRNACDGREVSVPAEARGLGEGVATVPGRTLAAARATSWVVAWPPLPTANATTASSTATPSSAEAGARRGVSPRRRREGDGRLSREGDGTPTRRGRGRAMRRCDRTWSQGAAAGASARTPKSSPSASPQKSWVEGGVPSPSSGSSSPNGTRFSGGPSHSRGRRTTLSSGISVPPWAVCRPSKSIAVCRPLFETRRLRVSRGR